MLVRPSRGVYQATLQRTAFALSAAVLMIWTGTAHAWNAAGHMTTGAMAYQDLQKRNPAVIPKVIALLKKNPDYKNKWKPMMEAMNLKESVRDEFIFMEAARWADDVRKTSFDVPSAHFFNFPFVPAGEDPNLGPAFTKADEKRKQDKHLTDIFKAYNDNLFVLKSSTSGPDRARALCWLFHLTGDVHQPLHSVARVTATLPTGDRGGNLFFLEPPLPPRTERDRKQLHSYWDGSVGTDSHVSKVHDVAEGLLGQAALQRSKLDELAAHTKIREWGEKESLPVAKSTVYTMGDGNQLPSGVTPDKKYKDRATIAAQRRAVLAGYRLADQLEEWAKAGGPLN